MDANAGLDVVGTTTMNGLLTQSGGQVTFNGNVDANAGLDVVGATTINGSVSQSNGAILLDVSGAGNKMTIGGLAAGTVTGATPDDVMLITTATNEVRRRSISDLIGAEQGVSYNETNTDGKLRLGANTNNKALFAGDRFINQKNFALNFTYTDGVAAPTTMLSLDEGNVSVNGIFTVAGTTSINGTNGNGATVIGNATDALNFRGSTINLNGVVNQAGGSSIFDVGGDSFKVLADGANQRFEVNTSSGGIQASVTGVGGYSELTLNPGTASLDADAGVSINTTAGATDIGNNAAALTLTASRIPERSGLVCAKPLR
ncbi:MAG: hypothetical protein EBV84_06425 [Betaproteobacteria bacterium]|nr:hypothetical protein [Betaproteobacteria bacterium]